MGKTLYEFLFGAAESLRDDGYDEAERETRAFRNRLFDDAVAAGTASRFPLSKDVRGLCGGDPRRGNGTTNAVFSFAEAEEILAEFVSSQSSPG